MNYRIFITDSKVYNISLIIALTLIYTLFMFGVYIVQSTQFISEQLEKTTKYSFIMVHYIPPSEYQGPESAGTKLMEQIYETINYLKGHGIKVYETKFYPDKLPPEYACNYMEEMIDRSMKSKEAQENSGVRENLELIKEIACLQGYSLELIAMTDEFNWNYLSLISGRYPEKRGECIIPLGLYYMINMGTELRLGDELRLTKYRCRVVGIYLPIEPTTPSKLVIVKGTPMRAGNALYDESPVTIYWVDLSKNRSEVLLRVSSLSLSGHPGLPASVRLEFERFQELSANTSYLLVIFSALALILLTLVEMKVEVRKKGIIISQGVPTGFLMRVDFLREVMLLPSLLLGFLTVHQLYLDMVKLFFSSYSITSFLEPYFYYSRPSLNILILSLLLPLSRLLALLAYWRWLNGRQVGSIIG